MRKRRTNHKEILIWRISSAFELISIYFVLQAISWCLYSWLLDSANVYSQFASLTHKYSCITTSFSQSWSQCRHHSVVIIIKRASSGSSFASSWVFTSWGWFPLELSSRGLSGTRERALFSRLAVNCLVDAWALLGIYPTSSAVAQAILFSSTHWVLHKFW